MLPKPLRLVYRLLLFLAAMPSLTYGQMLTGTSVPDSAIPTLIAPPDQGSTYFVLNQDLSILRRDSLFPNNNTTCPAPSGFSTSLTTPRTLLNDNTSAYFTSMSSSTNSAASAAEPGSICTAANIAAALSISGGVPTQTFTTNDPAKGRLYVLNAFGGSGADTLTVINNLNTNQSSTPTLTQRASVSLDTGATYTSMVTDVHSSYGLTAITELKTGISPGNLWVYSPGITTPFKILGPGGVALPAIKAFIIPATNNDNGDLLILVNQDNLTPSNLNNPPAVTTPFTIIDLGQLQRAFSSVVASGSTITLPSLTTISATTPYYSMLGAGYSPVFHLLYALVAGASSSGSTVESIIRYDPTNPSAPGEAVIADVSNIPFTYGTYPQVALNAVNSNMLILSGGTLYSAGIAGKNNIATAVTGTPFSDTNFKPTSIATNQLLGESYIASSSGQVDILTRAATSTMRATVELYGQDNAIANQSYTLYATTNFPTYDQAFYGTTVTFTATPAGGTPFTLATSTVGALSATNGNVSATFPSAGTYTIVASVPATTSYPAFTSLPLNVTVGATAVAGVYPTTLTLSVPATASGTTTTADLTLAGSTYAPTGRIVVSDANGNEVGRYTFTGAATAYPVKATLTLPTGASTLTATYNGDSQNQKSTSAAAKVTVGPSTQVTPTLVLAVPSTGTAGATLSGTVTFGSTNTTAPTDVISIYAVPAGTTNPITLTTITAAQAFTSAGRSFTFTAPAAGSYTLLAYYPGDTNYATATSPTTAFVSSAVSKGTISLGLSIPTSVTVGTASTVGNVTTTLSGSNTATPSGTVTILAQNTNGSSVTLATFPAANAKTTLVTLFSFATPPSGTYAVTANYPGDANFNAATSNVITLTSYDNGPTTTTLGLSAPSLATEGTPFTLTVTLKPKAVLQAAITGNVVVTASPLLNSGVPVVIATIPAAQAIGSSGVQAQATLPKYGALDYSLTAVYAGDANYGASNGSIGVTVFTTPKIAITAPATGTAGTPVNIDVLTSGNTPTGNVSITTTLNGAAGPGTSIPATTRLATLTFASAGTYTINASYAGDLKNSSASSASVTIVITGALTGAQFSMSLDDATRADANHGLVLDQGRSGDVALTLTAQNGFNTPVLLSSATSDRFNGIISFLDASGNTVTGVTPTTSGTHVSVHFINTVQSASTQHESSRGGQALVLCGLVGMSLFGMRRRVFGRHSLHIVGFLVVIACGMLLPGCTVPTDQVIRVTITATPSTATQGASAQSTTFYIDSRQ